jgi:hypothetical protein
MDTLRTCIALLLFFDFVSGPDRFFRQSRQVQLERHNN